MGKKHLTVVEKAKKIDLLLKVSGLTLDELNERVRVLMKDKSVSFDGALIFLQNALVGKKNTINYN